MMLYISTKFRENILIGFKLYSGHDLHTEIAKWHNSTKIQGVKKVRRHYTISYNFSSNDLSIIKLHRFQELFNTKVFTM